MPIRDPRLKAIKEEQQRKRNAPPKEPVTVEDQAKWEALWAATAAAREKAQQEPAKPGSIRELMERTPGQ